MADVRPFSGFRFDVARVGDLGEVLCPPYDVVDEEGERRYRSRSPVNAIRVELSTASRDEDRYEAAARSLKEWRANGTLTQDDAPAYYLHEARFTHRGQARVRHEVIAAVRLEPWERRVVLPHERTYPRPKADRLRLLEATRTNISPVLSFFRRDGSARDPLSDAWDWAASRPADAAGTDLEGVEHRLWVLTDAALIDPLRRFFAERPLFIADGHHRYETALYYRDRRREQDGARHEDDDPSEFVMMHLFAEDDPGVVILPIHRLLGGLDGLDAASLEERLAQDFHAEHFPLWPDAPPEQIDAYMTQLLSSGRSDRVVGLYGPDPEIFSILTVRARDGRPLSVPSDRDPAWWNLDVVLANEAIVRPLLAERGLDAEDVIEYTRDAHEAFARVRSGERQLAILLNPTRIGQIADVALAGERMPEKSTYFYPKAPTGLVFRSLD